MIDGERLATYINSLDTGNSQLLNRIEREALDNAVPIIRKETQQVLKMLVAMNQPERILEIGTAVGFSALLMAEAAPESCEIVTIESYEKRIPLAKKHFRESEYASRITLLEGDAAEILPTITDPFDFIFMDAAKGQYINFLPEVLRLLQPGGVLGADNVLQDGDLLESHFAVTRRNRTIHKRMREYLYQVTHQEELVSAVIPVGDGLTVSTKKK